MTTQPLSHIRNFAIIAHIDHGKSTLADRLIQTTGAVAQRDMKEQILDSMDIERERGITIKAQTVRLAYKAKDGETYTLNLMDTPGHVDFAYEVSRSLAACEGSLLVVDASQGVEAQTLANVYQAIDNNHEIVPILNKVDLPAAEPERVKSQIEDVIGLDASNAVEISAKTGLNIEGVPGSDRHPACPPPKGDPDAPLKALLVDSWYDAYLGVMVLVRIVDGVLQKGMKVRMMRTGAVYEVERVGLHDAEARALRQAGGPVKSASSPLSIKGSGRHTAVGDTITDERRQTAESRCPASVQRSRWCSAACSRSTPPTSRTCAPPSASYASTMPASLSRWKPRPPSASASAAASSASCTSKSFQERLEREFNLDLIAHGAPSVIYKMLLTDGTDIELQQSGRTCRR